MLLKAQLMPVETVALNHLSTEDVSAFIRLYSEKHHLNWTEAYIDDLTAVVGGYPPGMIEMVKSALNK
jgi:hypothetical protein